MYRRYSIAVLLLLLLLFISAGCKSDDAKADQIVETPTPTLHPTFTPTPPVATRETLPPTATPAATLEPTTTPLPTPTPVVEKPQVKVLAAKIGLRSGPSSAYPGVGVLEKDKIVDIIAKNEKATWLQVQFDKAKTAWISNNKKNVQVSGNLANVAVAKNVSPPPGRVQVTADKVNFRKGPGTAYPVVGQGKKGQVFFVAAKNKDASWLEIKLKGGKTAWVINDKRWTKAIGNIKGVAVAQNIPAPPPTPKPRPTAKPAPTATPAPSYLFTKLSMEQRINTNTITTFFGGLFSRNLNSAIGGYKMVAIAPTGERKEALFGDTFLRGDPGFDSEFIYNAKIEFAGAPAGSYNVFVADGGGNQVSEIWTAAVSGETRTFLPRWKQK